MLLLVSRYFLHETDQVLLRMVNNRKRINNRRDRRSNSTPKELFQVRVHPQLKKELLEVVEQEKKTNLSEYVIRVLQDHLDIRHRVFPYFVKENSIDVVVDEGGQYLMEAEQTILLCCDLDTYTYYIDLNREKVKRFLKEKRSLAKVWIKDYPSIEVFENNQPLILKHKKVGDYQKYQTGGVFTSRFPLKTRGAELKIKVKAAFKDYALTTKLVDSQERDRVLFHISEPTDVFKLNLKISKKLFERDKETKRLTDEHICNSMLFEVLDLRQVKINETINNDYRYGYSSSIQRVMGKITKNDSDFFCYELTVNQPLWGLFYGVSWVCPLSKD